MAYGLRGDGGGGGGSSSKKSGGMKIIMSGLKTSKCNNFLMTFYIITDSNLNSLTFNPSP